MANSVPQIQVLEDGDRNVVVKVVGIINSADVGYTIVFDPADYFPNLGKLRVDGVEYAVEEGLTVRLWWDGVVPVLMHTFDQSDTAKFVRFGGLQNNAADPSGRIALTTEGWAEDAILNFSLTVWMVKQVNPTTDAFLLQENGAFLLQENGGGILL